MAVQESATIFAKDKASGSLPLTVAYAEQPRFDAASQNGTHYSTATTASGPQNVMDDGAIKDED